MTNTSGHNLSKPLGSNQTGNNPALDHNSAPGPDPVSGIEASVAHVVEPTDLMERLDSEISHVWMVRAFLKHSEEAAEDEELAEVHRDLYDYMLALGPSLEKGDADEYLKMAWKKLRRLRRAAETFKEIQPEVSGHMNFQMANRSLQLAVTEIESILSQHRGRA